MIDFDATKLYNFVMIFLKYSGGIKGMRKKLKNNIEKVIIGKSEVIDLVLTALIAGGHVLLDDVPGTGKTTLAKALASSVDGTYSRVQFTPDLLPTDITGVNVYDM